MVGVSIRAPKETGLGPLDRLVSHNLYRVDRVVFVGNNAPADAAPEPLCKQSVQLLAKEIQSKRARAFRKLEGFRKLEPLTGERN